MTDIYIAFKKPQRHFFVAKRITNPVALGWEFSPCGRVAVSLKKRYFLCNDTVRQRPAFNSRDKYRQVFMKINGRFIPVGTVDADADIQDYIQDVVYHYDSYVMVDFSAIAPQLTLCLLSVGI